MSLDTSIKILLVEDSKIMRKMEIKTLHELGFKNILEADDGDEAISQLEDDPGIQLIISDWNMPNKDGYELLQWVRADEKCRDIPFTMATAQSDKSQARVWRKRQVSQILSPNRLTPKNYWLRSKKRWARERNPKPVKKKWTLLLNLLPTAVSDYA